MNNVDPRTPTADLPEFLSDGQPAAEGTDPAEEGAVEETYAEEPAEDYADDQGEEPRRADRRHARGRTRRGPSRSAGGGALVLGVLGVLGGLGLMFAGDDVKTRLQPYGVTPTTSLLLGAIALGIGAQTRRTARLEAYLGEFASRDDGDVVDRMLDALASRMPAGDAEANAQLALVVQRQDEKLNNLTKAIKMYGKPLMEIAAHGTELAASIAQVRTTMETGHDVARQAYARLESQVRAQGDVKASLQPVQEAIGAVNVAVQAVAQRLEDSEVRKSLLRLEETTQAAAKEMQKLLRGENIEAATTRLTKQLDDTQKRLQGGLDQLRDGNLSGMETSIRDIQREVATVATALAQIQAAMKSGARPVASAAATPAPAAAAAPAPAEATDAAPATGAGGSGGKSADKSAEGYQTGKRNSTGKNVLGAIAKLKQMKN